MQIRGKATKEEIKDVGKGKDSEANEVTTMTVKLDTASGIRGTLYFVPDDDLNIQLGDVVTVEVSVKQGKLDLAPRQRRGKQPDAAH